VIFHNSLSLTYNLPQILISKVDVIRFWQRVHIAWLDFLVMRVVSRNYS